MTKLPRQLSPDQLQSKWAAVLDPVITNPFNNGIQLTGIKLSSGINTINHKLSRKCQGYVITSTYEASSEIYRLPSSMPEATLVLSSTDQCTIDIYVY